MSRRIVGAKLKEGRVQKTTQKKCYRCTKPGMEEMEQQTKKQEQQKKKKKFPEFMKELNIDGEIVSEGSFVNQKLMCGGSYYEIRKPDEIGPNTANSNPIVVFTDPVPIGDDILIYTVPNKNNPLKRSIYDTEVGPMQETLFVAQKQRIANTFSGEGFGETALGEPTTADLTNDGSMAAGGDILEQAWNETIIVNEINDVAGPVDGNVREKELQRLGSLTISEENVCMLAQCKDQILEISGKTFISLSNATIPQKQVQDTFE